MKRALATGAGAVVGVLALGVSPAGACHPEVVATSVCVDGAPAIHVIADAWETDLGEDWRTNVDVRIDVWNGDAWRNANGAFTAPEHRMSATFPMPDAVGQTFTVRATAAAPWGLDQDLGFAGEYRETWVTVTDVCRPETPATLPTEPAVPASPSPDVSEAAPSPPAGWAETSEVATSRAPAAAPTQVLGVSVSQGAAPQAASAPTLAFTGRSTAHAALAGATLLLLGALLLLASRPPRHPPLRRSRSRPNAHEAQPSRAPPHGPRSRGAAE